MHSDHLGTVTVVDHNDPRCQDWNLFRFGGASPDYHTYLTEPVMNHFETPLTPPLSQSPPDTIVPVSTAFYPGSHSGGYNLVFSSADSVLFYVHTDVLTEKSRHAFHNVLPQLLTKSGSDPSIVSIHEPSAVLDVMLHIIYNLECSKRDSAFTSVVTAIDRMPVYEVDPRDYLVPGNVNYNYVLSFAPLRPLELYTLAGYHDLVDLATAVSSHLLSLSLATIDDSTATRMGAVYLKRLFRLHFDRSTILKDILLIPPHPHPPLKNCNFADQKYVTRAWALVAAHLAWDARPDLSTARIRSAFGSLDEQISCPECKQMIHNRLKDVVNRWACASHTIAS